MRLLSFCLLLIPTFYTHAITVGVFDIRGDVGNDGGKLADLAQNEIQSDKSLTVRDRLAVKNIIAQQEKCAAGMRECPELSGALKTLDVYVTGEAVTLAGQKQVILRAVKTGDQKIAALAVGNGDTLEKSMAEAAADLKKKMAGIHTADAGASDKWKIAVQPIRAANAAAQNLSELSGLDSMLILAADASGVGDPHDEAAVSIPLPSSRTSLRRARSLRFEVNDRFLTTGYRYVVIFAVSSSVGSFFIR